jgi:inosose dehydratase
VRIAGAPISWGVCEVPGWGHQLSPDRVLAEMCDAGLAATEFGPDGFLPADPDARSALLTSYGLGAVGGFVPVVLHDPAHDPLPDVRRALSGFGDAGTLVLAAATGLHGYDERPALTGDDWRTLLTNLERIAAHAAGMGVLATLHPHVGTVVEGPGEVDRVLAGSGVPLCLDTGHLLIGGTDPLELARTVPDRIAHVHLKDVDADLAARVRDKSMTLVGATQAGLFRPLGEGDARIDEVVALLDEAGYGRWLVLEQDLAITGPEPSADGGPALDVRTSIEFLSKPAPRREVSQT